jgi:hypothetical protein
MNDKIRVVTPAEAIARAFANFFRDLLSGDVVAVSICFGVVMMVAVIVALGAWFVWQRKKTDEKFKKKVAAKRKKEDEQYKASKDAPEI